MIGKIISHYRITQMLGGGGMGIVYKALDLKLDRYVALKFLPLHLSANEDEKRRFIQEARMASSLDHPNICTIHEIGESEDGQLYIVMAFYQGETLKKRLDRGALEFCDAINIMKQILAGLEKAHANNIIHRDIKPANIMLTDDGVAKIVDFGLAKLMGQSEMIEKNSSAGTIAYMSPENVQGLDIDHRADLWSAAVLLYQMISGQLPFDGRYDEEIVYNIVNVPHAPVDRNCEKCEVDYTKVFAKALAKDIHRRYSSTEEMLADFPCSELTQVPPHLAFSQSLFSSQKAKAKVSVFSRRRTPVMALAVLVIFILGFWGYAKILKNHKPAQFVSLAVVDFVNETDDEILDGLSGQLVASLENSPALHVLPRARMFDILKQLDTLDVGMINEHVGKEICKRANVRILLIPIIRQKGSHYQIDIKVSNPVTDSLLFALREEGQGLPGIFTMIDRLSEKIEQEFIGNDFKSAPKSAATYTNETFYAHQHFFKGEEYLVKGNYDKAQQEFSQALRYDSTFALAFYGLASVIKETSQDEQIIASLLSKANIYIEQVPRKYRYLLRAEMAYTQNGAPASLEILTEMEKIYPNEKTMLFELANCYYMTKQYDESIEYLKTVLQMDPEYLPAFQRLVQVYTSMRRYDLALRAANQYRKIDELTRMLEIAGLYKKTGNLVGAIRYYTKSTYLDSTNVEALDGLLHSWKRLNENDKMLDAAIRLAYVANSEYHFREIVYAFARAGYTRQGLRVLNDVKLKFPERGTYIDCEIASLHQFNDDFDKAEIILLPLINSQDRQTRRLGYDRLYKTYLYMGKYTEALAACDSILELFQGLPKRRAKIKLRKGLVKLWGWSDKEGAYGEAKSAIAAQTTVSSPEYWNHLSAFYLLAGEFDLAEQIYANRLNSPASVVEHSIRLVGDQDLNKSDSLIKPIFSGLAGWEKIRILFHFAKGRLAQGKYDEAILLLKELQTQWDNYGGFRAAYYPQSYFLLAKAYELQGKSGEAMQNYRTFLNLWKHADQDLPALKEAQIGLERLIHISGTST